MRVPYTYPEAEAIERDYDEQIPLGVIAENVNRDFHNGNPVRTANSVRYVINKIYHGDDWYGRIEEAWLNENGK
ncbi:hypothetical protein [Brevibacillus daliensis]|uniref:hypothetical protein n=1 Tax=Brevibacillus daliensis TaxID=2892995 RepID=UPI001E62DFDD|nr:hypothetical protein [Brevibacillus daliensis]